MSRKKSAARPKSDKPTVTNVRSGGTDIAADRVDVGGDVVGRDKVMHAGDDIVMGDQVEAETYIEHATIVNDRTNRVWLYALAGVIGVIIIVLGIIATRSNTPASVTVIIPTNAPLPDTPVPTATPIFVKNVPYRVAIAKFNQLADRKLAIEQRLQDDLDQQLEAAGLSNEVEVKFVSQPLIGSAQDAQQFAQVTNSSVVVWGLYDDVGIRLRISLNPSVLLSQTMPEVARFGELPLTPSGNETNMLSFYITSTLPANTSFLSFYVIGHLYYLSNQYAKGHAAFDAATQQLPKTVAIENDALLHFFNARAMDTTTDEGAINAICEYIRAIAANDQLVEAYNNLGILIGQNEQMPAGSFRIDQDDRVKACASQAAIKLEARQLFSDALRIRPDLAIVQYNLGVLDWNTLANCSTDDSCEHDIEANQAMLKIREQAEAEFVTALKSDPSIPGAHIELGNMAVWRGDFATAIDQFSTTVRLAPQSLEAAFNLGQALALTDHESEAENAYRQAIRLAPVNSIPSMEAHLALGYLYYQQGKPAQAGIEYEQTQEQLQQARSDDSYYLSSRSFYSEGALELALTKYEIDAGQLISASQRAHSNSYFSPLQSYLAWLIGSAYGLTTTVQSEVYYTITGDYAATPFIAWSYGDVNAMTWNDLLKQCKTSAVDDFRTWGSSANPCLPSDPQKRISAVFEIIQRRMQQRLFFTDVAPGEGMACPYILTYDNQSRQWSFDTTILYQLIGPQSETAQARRLSRFDGRLWLQEVEPERSYVDSLTVRLTMTDGREIVLKPNEPLLDTADGQYLVLHQGDQLLLTFDVPKGSLPAREAWVVATGYYIPLHR